MTSTTRYGKLDDRMRPLEVYLGLGVGYIASEMSSRVKQLAETIKEAMDYPGFSIVHVQSPCTTYNDTYALLKGDEKNGVEPLAKPIPDEHDPSDFMAAMAIARGRSVPLGLLYKRAGESVPQHERLARAVHPPSGVRLDQVENRRDPEGLERVLLLVTDALDDIDIHPRQFARGDGLLTQRRRGTGTGAGRRGAPRP